MISSRFILSIAMIFAFCLIDFTLIEDIAGGFIFKILIDFTLSDSFLLKGISLVYILCLATWLFQTQNNQNYQKLTLTISTIILAVPILLALFWQSKNGELGLTFLLPSIAFLVLLFFQWRVILKF